MSTKPKPPTLHDLRPRLTVIGVGGAGCNAVNNMIAAGLTGAEFVVANTDAQALIASSAEHRVQLGTALTEGLGAGSKPEVGEAAAEEAVEELKAQLAGSHMIFVAAGMGGGTGTGAAAVVARIARELGILTVAIVTKPFLFEGTRRMRIADIGIAELKKYVDTLIVIPNQNLFRVANERTTFAEAFVLADQVLYSGVACIVDLIVKEGLINLDFADVRTVMSGMGTAMMGTGEASGERRAILAAEEAIANPLLDDVTLRGARGLLLSISGGRNLTLYEVDEAASRVRAEVDPEANIIVGATFDESLGDRIRVSIVASGMLRQEDQGREVRSRPDPAAMPTSGSAPGAPFQPGPQMSPNHPHPVAQGEPVHRPMGQSDPRTRRDQEAAAEAETQRRLTEALQADALDGNAAVGWGAPPRLPHSLPPLDTAGRPHGPELPAKSGSGGGTRAVWQAPGAVMIEEAPPPQPVRRAEAARSAPPNVASTFSPELTTEVRRSQRRFPEVEEFPVVGQRDYHAKTGKGGEAPLPTHPARRPGLLERFTGIGRRPADSASKVTPQTQSAHAPGSAQASRPPPHLPQSNGWATMNAPDDGVEPIEFPQTYTRDRK